MNDRSNAASPQPGAHENTEAPTPTPDTGTILETLPSWAMSSFIEDGMVYSTRPSVSVQGGELIQASRLVLDPAAGTVKCQRAEEPTIWLPDESNRGLTVAQAKAALHVLQELLTVLDAGERP